ANRTSALTPGTQQVELAFPGGPLHHTGDGAYALTLSIYDEGGRNRGSYRTTTGPLTASVFDAFLEPDGSAESEGIDRDGDGTFDVLQIRFGADVDSAGTYRITGLLRDGDSDAFAFAATQQTLAAGANTVMIDFSGLRINEHETNGPFTLAEISVLGKDGQSLDRIPLGHTTAAYAYTAFETAYTLTSTGLLAEQTTDVDGNGLFDTLTVSLEINSSRDGTLQASGDLFDADGRRVASGTGSVDVRRDIPAYLPLAFDGRQLYGSLQDDAFTLRNVFIHPEGDYGQGLQIDSAGRTSVYSHLLFEPAAVVTGLVYDPEAGGPFAPGVYVSNGRGASDVVDEQGRYRLVFLESGGQFIQAQDFDNPGALWLVYVDDVFVGEQNSAYVQTEVGAVRSVDFRSQTALPVELTAFEAVADGTDVRLSWRTASETNNAGFEIEARFGTASHAPDAAPEPWQTLAFVEGHGTSSAPHTYAYAASDMPPGQHRFRLRQLDFDGQASYSDAVEVEVALPGEVTLEAAYPNPFNPRTTIRYSLPREAQVRLTVHDALGREVARLVEAQQPAGRYEVLFDAVAQASGIYFYRIEAGSHSQVRSMVLAK
ncbi:MAG: T9SS type A sorting domain-containing protein, partial [Rhodothermales bacterium]